jgi:hypothetical protein
MKNTVMKELLNNCSEVWFSFHGMCFNFPRYNDGYKPYLQKKKNNLITSVVMTVSFTKNEQSPDERRGGICKYSGNTAV